jgi:pimeloyl-ACP methyl ester carboxylesterase
VGAQPFRIAIPDARLEDLEQRLRRVNWPRDLANDDWRYGTNGAYLRELVDYWIEGYDWRAQERALNAFDHFRVQIDGVPIHFVHAKGRGPDPLPIVLTHGWPWTFWDVHRVIGPLCDPAAHGGDPADAFDVVVPSLPGFVFSTPLEKPGVNWWRTADLWVSLMRDTLGYERFAAHGGDWGALVTMQLGHKYEDLLVGIHLSNAFPMLVFAGERPWSIGEAAAGVAPGSALRPQAVAWERKFASHIAVHVLDPQTLAYALHDSPVGLCAWILERRRAWGDCRGDVESRFSKDHLLTTMMLYWLTDSFVTSVRYYYEAAEHQWQPVHERAPAIAVPPRPQLRWALRRGRGARCDRRGHPRDLPAAALRARQTGTIEEQSISRKLHMSAEAAADREIERG